MSGSQRRKEQQLRIRWMFGCPKCKSHKFRTDKFSEPICNGRVQLTFTCPCGQKDSTECAHHTLNYAPLEIGDCGQRDHKRRITKADRVAAARASRELLPLFLGAIGRKGMSLTDAARELVVVPYSAISRWTGGSADLPPKYLESVTEWASK